MVVALREGLAALVMEEESSEQRSGAAAGRHVGKGMVFIKYGGDITTSLYAVGIAT